MKNQYLCLLFMLFNTSLYASTSGCLYVSTQSQAYVALFPINKSLLSSQMNGAIQDIYFRPGDRFRKGDVLAKFDCEEIDLKAKRFQAELASADAQLKSILELAKLNSASKVELTKAKSNYDIAQADLDIIKFQQKQCQVVAPYDGEVINQYAYKNETMKIDDPLIEIIDNQDLEVKLYIPSSWLSHVKIGTHFSFMLDELPEQCFDGVVVKIVGQIDSASQSILIYGKVDEKLPNSLQDKSYALLSGMSGVAYFVDVINPSTENSEKKFPNPENTGLKSSPTVRSFLIVA